MRTGDIMQTDLVWCAPTATAVEAAALMTERGVGACLVMDDRRLAGIFTERDLLRAVAEGTDARHRSVSDLMTRDVTLAPADADLVWAADTMRRIRARHLPIAQDGNVVGIISLRDLFAAVEGALRLDPRGLDGAREVLRAATS